MADATQTTFVERLIDRERLTRLADGLAVAVAVSLPWSITATGILVALWLIASLSTIDPVILRRTIVLPVAALPLALCLLAALGVLWSDAALADQFGSFKVFLRLSIIVLILVQFQRSDRGMWVLVGFLVSCTVLLAVSWLVWTFPALDWRRITPGVPVKDHIIQSGEFLICAFALGHLTVSAWNQARYRSAITFGLLALIFLANIVIVAAARSVLVIFAIFVIVFGFQRFGWKGAFGLAMVAAVLSAVTWTSSPYLRARVQSIIHEVHDYEISQTQTSSGYRIEFWKKSIAIISDAPILGHGTGSMLEQFRRFAAGDEGISSLVTDNPHNQTLVVAIQLGLIGVALLYAMWIVHLLLFRGNELAAWLGFGIVVHNIGAGLSNSQLFEATLGWLYIFGVGVLGGMVLRNRQAGTQLDGAMTADAKP